MILGLTKSVDALIKAPKMLQNISVVLFETHQL